MAEEVAIFSISSGRRVRLFLLTLVSCSCHWVRIRVSLIVASARVLVWFMFRELRR